MKKIHWVIAALALAFTGGIAQAAGGNVKVTPLGSHDGEFCVLDRALIFEDPDGTRILYDAGRTVRGPDDPRLGNIEAILVTHMHGDHLGDVIQPSANAGACGKPDFSVKTTPSSNSVNIAVAKKANILVGSEFDAFLAPKVKAAGGDPKSVRLVRFGADAKVGGVHIATVPAAHSSGISPGFVEGDLAKHLGENGLNAYAGPPTGYVLRFSNGLVVYLSGDTGITAEQELVVRGYYKANLAVMNIGDLFTTGPVEAAYVINKLVKPKSVIVSHANEPATEGGKLRPNTKTAKFIKATKVPVHIPLSGVTMEFNGKAKCVAGC
ncbi:MAG: MBL fold metallo-hydrolase [Burkholderiales bacterium]|nr:MBL fold metallo-hydrolase [Burkholderiales bacterium]